MLLDVLNIGYFAKAMFPKKVGKESSEATLLSSPVQSHGKSQHRALAGNAARSHVSNLGWSAATPEDVPRRKTAAAAQPHCHCLAFHAPRICTVTSVLLHTMRSALCGCSAALSGAKLWKKQVPAMVVPLRTLAASRLQLPTLLGNIAYLFYLSFDYRPPDMSRVAPVM